MFLSCLVMDATFIIKIYTNLNSNKIEQVDV